MTVAGRDRGGDPRAGARRGRLHPGAAALPRAASSSICREHGILFIADEVQIGLRPHRQVVRRRALRRRARHHLHGEGHRLGLPVLGARHPAELDDQVADRAATAAPTAATPIGCAAALATIEVLTGRGFLDDVSARGEQLRAGLRELQPERPGDRPGARPRADGRHPVRPTPARVAAIAAHCLDEGHLILMNAGTYGTTLRCMPPLVVTAQEIDDRARCLRRRGEGDGLMSRPDPERLVAVEVVGRRACRSSARSSSDARRAEPSGRSRWLVRRARRARRGRRAVARAQRPRRRVAARRRRASAGASTGWRRRAGVRDRARRDVDARMVDASSITRRGPRRAPAVLDDRGARVRAAAASPPTSPRPT